MINEYGYKKHEMGVGESFGEKALLSEDSKRTATILTLTPCKFIVIMRDDYIVVKERFNHLFIKKK